MNPGNTVIKEFTSIIGGHTMKMNITKTKSRSGPWPGTQTRKINEGPAFLRFMLSKWAIGLACVCLHATSLAVDLDPISIGTYDTYDAMGVTLSNHYAYVADSEAGLLIFDVSDPANPQPLGSCDTPGVARVIALSGHYAYIADETGGLQIADVSNSSDPRPVGCYPASGTSHIDARGIAVSGNYAYVAAYQYGLLVIDISDPTSPELVGSLPTVGGGAYSVAVSGHHAYLADTGSGLEIIDVSNPYNPTWTARYTSPYGAYAVALSANCAYLAGLSFEVIDIRDPANPQRVGGCGSYSAWSVAVAGNYAYVADLYGGMGLQVIDISDPANPHSVGGNSSMVNARGVAVDGPYVYVAAYGAGLHVLDTRHIANPQRVGSYDSTGLANAVAVSGHLAYAADSTVGLEVIDVSNPSIPQQIGSYATGGYAEDVAVSGHHVYVLDAWTGLQVIDVSNPANPQWVGSYDTSWYVRDIEVSGDYAYIADAEEGLQIINVGNPANPQLIGSYDPAGSIYGLSAESVAVSGHFAYLAARNYLFVIDISDPAHPVALGTCAAGVQPEDVAVSDHYVYVADRFDGLHVIDVSNPTSPNSVGLYPAEALGVAVSGPYAYLAGGGLQVIDVSDPANPQRVGGDQAFSAWDVELAGSNVFMVGSPTYSGGPGSDQGLIILDLFNPDRDGDTVLDKEDQCPNSDLSPTIAINGRDSGVANRVFPTGCSLADLITSLVAEAAGDAPKRGAFVSNVAQGLNALKELGLITGQEQGAIQRCLASEDKRPALRKCNRPQKSHSSLRMHW